MTIENLYHVYLSHPTVCTDTRSIEKGCLFFCLRGDTFDGNTFATKALEQGAAFVITEDATLTGEGFIHTPNALLTLQQLALHHRMQLNIPVLGITGTNGKTTTKELVKAVLERKFKVSATVGNLNNHIGVPLSLLRIHPDTEIAIIEMGANHPGEIAELCTLADPNFGIITNIGKAHLEGFGSFENIIRTKEALYIYVRNHDGILFVNEQNELLIGLSENCERITYGTGEDAAYRGSIIDSNPVLKIQWDEYEINTRMTGKYNFENIMSAIAVGCFFGVPETEIVSALEEYAPSNSRSQLLKTATNFVILDAYNANPTSMEAALENFNAMDGIRKALLLGDMLELGETREAEHRGILNIVANMNVDLVLLTGPVFSAVCEHKEWHCFANSDDTFVWLQTHPISGYSVLVKGSRGIRLEKAVPAL
ncbi:MAG: UDP-N-acetylmuramoyl-tripeptide--D-alanyl-D-alanine ligase [Bacteroidota bacterium]